MKELTQEYLKSILDYNPDTGIFVWKERRKSNQKKGKVAGTPSNGYIRISINFKKFRAHRLAFLYMEGRFPEEVDHINGVRDDNRWINLRNVSKSINQRNSKLRKNNTSGISGVFWCKRTKKWRSCIKLNGKYKYLGYFTDFFEACCARKSAEVEHNFHPNHGRVVA